MDDECDFSDRDPELDDSLELAAVWERDGDVEDAACLLLEPSGRETPVSVDSIPLEWDHTVDVGGSSSPEDEDEVTYYSALSGKMIEGVVLSFIFFTNAVSVDETITLKHQSTALFQCFVLIKKKFP